MKRNTASQSIGAQMITALDGTIFTGAVSVSYTIDSGTQTGGGGTAPVHEGGGYHSYTPLQAETNGAHIAYTFSGTGAISSTVQVYTQFPQSVDNNTKISLIPTTAMRGTDGANTTAPDNTGIANILTNTSTTIPSQLTNMSGGTFNAATDSLEAIRDRGDSAWITGAGGSSPTVIQIREEMDLNSTKLIDIVADTNELQLNQGNWITATGFSTFDAGVDTVVASNMRGTDGANTVIPPSVIEFNARTLPTASYSQFDYTANEVQADINKINGVVITGNGNTVPFDV